MNNQSFILRVNSHLVENEIMRRCLPVKTAVGETARAFGIEEGEVEKMALIGTGVNSFSELEEIYHGRLLKGDIVLNANPRANEQNTCGAFNVVPMDGNILVQQCHTVLRRIEVE